MKIQLFVFLWCSILLSNSIFGQAEVMNTSFGKMLDTLLSHAVQEIVPEQLKDKSAIIYLDAREKSEYNVSHIKDAIWVGYTGFKKKRIDDVDKNAEVVVYCSVGYRSEKIAERLKKLGFKNVSNLYGGIFEWAHHNNEVYNENGVTDSIHAYDKNWGQWLETGNKVYK